MARLEDLTPGATVRGLAPLNAVRVVAVKWYGSNVLEVTYTSPDGQPENRLVYREDEPRFSVLEAGRTWSFDADGRLFKLAAEAQRIRWAPLFDTRLAVHTSLIEPLPHQITAVYEAMLPRQPLRFLLADDPGAGKTIMTGLLVRELMARGDVERCMVVAPGSLVEQWQDELSEKFGLAFEILTNDKLESSRSGNWFDENPLAICRLDKLARDEDLQARLKADWDLIVVDEAHKMSATYFGTERKETKRFKLGHRLKDLTRHFLLLTATPHNGKEVDFQLFLSLLDADRFEGRASDPNEPVDASDLMRRLVKESLLKFDGRPLFPERRAETVSYELSPAEADLYARVTEYVREQFNLADRFEDENRKGTVGFALTILQRRLASSPAAIHESLGRRKKRLQSRLREVRQLSRAASLAAARVEVEPLLSPDDIEELEDLREDEVERVEHEVLDGASAALTIAELEPEIEILQGLEELARRVRYSTDGHRKWLELARILQDRALMLDEHRSRRKLIVFTEHRDTLTYLVEKARTLLPQPEAVVAIHGSLARKARREAQERFTHDRDAHLLIATDAAGEGVNLQVAHLMVNFDIPWNPNRIEQRFGRIHRIGQTEVCHLWNVVAKDTREWDVFERLFTKLEVARRALGGQVFDVLGRLTFEGRPLRDLLIEAIRYGSDPARKAHLDEILDRTLDQEHLKRLLEERAIACDSMDGSVVRQVRDEMDRAEARRLQPHYISSFFGDALEELGGSWQKREPERWEITHVPAQVRNRGRELNPRDPVLPRYERVTFERSLVAVPGRPKAKFVYPGTGLLDTTVDVVLERHRDLLKRGAVLVDPQNLSGGPRMLFFVEHVVQDAMATRQGPRRVASRELRFVEIDEHGQERNAGYAPYLDYRNLNPEEAEAVQRFVTAPWLVSGVEERALAYAAQHLAPDHLGRVRSVREDRVKRTLEQVHARLTTQIAYWDNRAQQLREDEEAGKVNARLNYAQARMRRDELERRLQQRREQLEKELALSARPPVVLAGALVIPEQLILAELAPEEARAVAARARETVEVERLAMESVMAKERSLGREPRDVSSTRCGYDIESRDPVSGSLLSIEVKGRAAGADTVTVTKNEILVALNRLDNYVLAIVEVDGERASVQYLTRPFKNRPDFAATSVTFKIASLLKTSVVDA